jgi:2-hydroxychromene-2-carboxylate isomerase
MPGTLEFLYDFGSPNAYLAWKVLPALAERTGAELRLIPCLLGGIFKATGNMSPGQAFSGVKGKLEYEALERERFILRHGLGAFRFNPHFPVNTLMIMRGQIAAETLGLGEAYRAAVFAAMWEAGEKMDDPAVLGRVLADAGLDAAAIFERAGTDAVKKTLIDNTESAVARGVFGSPTFFVGDEMFFGKERLGQIEELLAGG